MDGYTPFPIFDFASGIYSAKQPWLAPKDAFQDILNAYIEKGVIKKRKGYVEFGRFVHQVVETIGTGTAGGQKTFSFTLTKTPIRTDVSVTDSVETFTDNGDGTLTGDAGGTGTIDYTSGAISVTFHAAPAESQNVDCAYNYYPGNPIMGLVEHKAADSSLSLLAFDTKRMCKYNTTTKVLDDVSTSDTWTGSDEQFFRFCNSSYGDLYITNAKDQIQKYDGSTLAAFVIDTDGNASNNIDTCRWIFEYKDHLIILAPTEDGTLYPRRYRCSEAIDYTSWPAANYVDCPTDDEIISARMIGDILYVWFKESLWKLVYVGYTSNPFEWQCVSTEEGSLAPMSTVEIPGNKALTIGKTSIVGTDMYTAFSANDQADDLTLKYSQDKIALSYAARVRELKQVWFTMCKVGSTSPDAMIVYNYKDGSYFTYDLPLTCIGFYAEQNTLTIDDISDVIDTISWAFDDISLQAGFPITLGGSSTGYIYKLNYGYNDNGEAIELTLDGNEWNPYVQQGRMARLGYIDIYHKSLSAGTLTVDCFANTEPDAYKSVTIDLTEAQMDKKFTRLKIGCVANFHRIKIYHDEADRDVQIEMITPWFKAEGPIR